MIRRAVHLLRIFKMFHGLMNNPVLFLLIEFLKYELRINNELLYYLSYTLRHGIIQLIFVNCKRM